MKDFSVRPRGWFDDEVAIDFPSLRALVERMREAFDGTEPEDRGDLLAELRLSAREAFDGVTVPLDVPVRKWCVPCGGCGEIWSEPCASCDGTGEALARHPVRLVVPPRVQDGDRFSLSVSAPSASPTRVEVRVVLS
ncbi:MAG: hypothetical protein ND807_04485 [Vicinamibacterales bacterium]|nr:hypothetical protein [Vicinamibacterales bacterium]